MLVDTPCGDELSTRQPTFVEVDLGDMRALAQIFERYSPGAVIYFVGDRAVGASVVNPLRYDDDNVGSTISLLQVMDRFEVRTLAFSSLATVYGDTSLPPLEEEMPRSATNPYGQTKVIIEDLLASVAAANPLADRRPAVRQPGRSHPSGPAAQPRTGSRRHPRPPLPMSRSAPE